MAWQRGLTRHALKARRFLATRVEGKEERGWTSYLLFLPAAFASGLGIWQVQRKSWKVKINSILSSLLDKGYWIVRKIYSD